MSFKIIVGDIECVGFKPDAQIIEIAWVELGDQMEVVNSFASLIDPEVPIPSHISGITGITDEDVVGEPTIDEFFDVVHKGELLKEPTLLVAHNAAFDLKFFKRHCDQVVGSLCTLRLARRFFPNLEDHKLATIKHHFEFERRDSHRALNDVLDTVDLLRICVQESGMSLLELIEDSKKPIEITVMPFGKHKGAQLASVPASYFKWLLGKDDGNLDPDLKASILKLRRPL